MYNIVEIKSGLLIKRLGTKASYLISVTDICISSSSASKLLFHRFTSRYCAYDIGYQLTWRSYAVMASEQIMIIFIIFSVDRQNLYHYISLLNRKYLLEYVINEICLLSHRLRYIFVIFTKFCLTGLSQFRPFEFSRMYKTDKKEHSSEH